MDEVRAIEYGIAGVIFLAAWKMVDLAATGVRLLRGGNAAGADKENEMKGALSVDERVGGCAVLPQNVGLVQVKEAGVGRKVNGIKNAVLLDFEEARELITHRSLYYLEDGRVEHICPSADAPLSGTPYMIIGSASTRGAALVTREVFSRLIEASSECRSKSAAGGSRHAPEGRE